MPNQFVTSWTDERVNTLTQLWAEGYSATRIAAFMDLTRSMVIGKVARLKLPPPAVKQPVVIDRTYTHQMSEERRAKIRAYERVYKKARREKQKLCLETKREVRERFLANGASPYSAAYRKHLPPMPDMSKAQMRAMLEQAMQNTAAL